MKVCRNSLILIVVLLLVLIYYATRPSHRDEFIRLIEQLPANRSWDSAMLVDLHVDHILDGDGCDANADVLAIIVVTSYFGNVETRSAMRRAFPREKLEQIGLRRVFLLGIAPEDKYTRQNAILDESRRFNDIVQGNFVEAYRNLTYKHLMGLRWASRHCSHAKYVVKMDDDIVVNVRKLKDLLDSMRFPRDFIAGYILRGMSPIREPANKWFVTAKEYSSSTYPTFVSGWLYVTTPRVCQELVAASRHLAYFWIDDVFVTGLLAQRAHLKHYSLKEIFTVHPEFLECCTRDADEFNYDCDIVVGPNGGNNDLFSIFNYAMAKCARGTGCVRRQQPLEDTCVAQRKYPLGKGNAVVETYKLT